MSNIHPRLRRQLRRAGVQDPDAPPDEQAWQKLLARIQDGRATLFTRNGHDWTDKELGRRSMILMAEEVMPRINVAIAAAA